MEFLGGYVSVVVNFRCRLANGDSTSSESNCESFALSLLSAFLGSFSVSNSKPDTRIQSGEITISQNSISVSNRYE